ncbi:hypothetical protein B0T10DRAFT_466745 [Thelonectria olida]|uniref:Uncharacterized protein n=1 Tax=Thelonectria olida TaxID=1576542 RepID=A0A9P8VPU9_9HYPO|nr:hypothetical protein B0T10DRAFT_466745 [Thelonectria olida]
MIVFGAEKAGGVQSTLVLQGIRKVPHYRPPLSPLGYRGRTQRSSATLLLHEIPMCPHPFPQCQKEHYDIVRSRAGFNKSRISRIDAAFVRVHAILFSGKAKERLQEFMEEFLELLDGHIEGIKKRWLEAGYFIGISLACSLLGYGDESSVLMNAIAQKPDQADVTKEGSNISEAPPLPSEAFTKALSFAFMSNYPTTMSHIEGEYPWKLTVILLNSLSDSSRVEPRMDEGFPHPEEDELHKPLPEDYAMRGIIFTGLVCQREVDEDEKYFELSSMVEERKERILYLGYRIATHQKWLNFDESIRRFVEDSPLEPSEQEHSPRRTRMSASSSYCPPPSLAAWPLEAQCGPSNSRKVYDGTWTSTARTFALFFFGIVNSILDSHSEWTRRGTCIGLFDSEDTALSIALDLEYGACFFSCETWIQGHDWKENDNFVPDAKEVGMEREGGGILLLAIGIIQFCFVVREYTLLNGS